MSNDHASEETLLERALTFDTAEERAAYLTGACPDNPQMRAQVESLVHAHHAAGAFLRDRTAAAEPTQRLPEAGSAEGIGQVIGRYKLLQKIGEGGCGIVYMADQQEPVRRRVALKIIKLGMDTKQVIARFEAERQALALMDHPNIAKVLDAGATDSGRPYFVMELVRGVRVTEYCDRKALSTGERLKLFMQICQAIQHAHQKGIIHRDIKPSNILVTVNDGVALPKVIDFGIAKATAGQHLTERTLFTAFEQFIGTPAYMSPEQVEMTSLDVDTRSDIYSLGVLLYELLTGKTPFDPEQLMALGINEMRRTIRETEPLRPSTRLATLSGAELSTTAHQRSLEAPKLVSALRGDLDWIVMKALEKDRARRYETANGLAKDIERHLNQEPVLARPPSAAYRFQKLVRRNKVAFATAAAVAGALVLGTIGSAWQALRATRAQRAVEAAHQREVQLREAAQLSARNEQQARAQESTQRRTAEGNRLTAERNLYVANMNLAQQAWEQNNLGRVADLLSETATDPNRGFEWFYWQNLAHSEIKTFQGHNGLVRSVAFLPNGRIVTASMDRTVKIWDVATGMEIMTLEGHILPIAAMALSRDRSRIYTGGGDRTIRCWDATSGAALSSMKSADWTHSLSLSPDEQRIVLGSRSPGANPTIWELATGKQLFTLKGHDLSPWKPSITSVSFSPEGLRIASGSEDHTARIWDAATGRELFALKGHDSSVNSLAFSPDGKRLVTASNDSSAKLWDATIGRELLTFKGHSAALSSAAFSPDGQRVVTGSADQTARLWDVTTGKPLLTFKGHRSAVTCVAFSPDGHQILTGSADETIKLWDTPSTAPTPALDAMPNSISCAAFSQDGQRILMTGDDRRAVVMDIDGRKELVALQGDGCRIKSAAFSPDGQRIVTGDLDHVVRIWSAFDGRELLSLQGHAGWISSVAVSPDGTRLVSESYDRTGKVWDALTGRELLTLKGHGEAVSSTAFSSDGKKIVTGSEDHTAKIWDAADGHELITLKGHRDAIRSVAFSPSGEQVVTGSDDRTAKVWDTATGRELKTLKGHHGLVRSVAFSADGQRIVTGSTTAGTEDGQWIVTGSDKYTCKVWDAAGGRELLTLAGSPSTILTVGVPPRGRQLLALGADGRVIRWAAATQQQVDSWQNEEQRVSERLEHRRREQEAAAEHNRALRAQDPGAIKHWLVLAPITFDLRQWATALDEEQIPHEANLRPKLGERVTVGQQERSWTAVEARNDLLDFNQLLGQSVDLAVAYAVCYIQSEAELRGLLVKVGSDDCSKIYLNGKQIYRSAEDYRSYAADEDVVGGVELKPGLNVLVFKVANHRVFWMGSVRFTDKEGNPVKGISVTLNPQSN